MGCCFSWCSKGESEAAPKREYTQISSNEPVSNALTEATGVKYYQSIVDDAQGQFINSTYRHKSGVETGAADLRSKLAKIQIDSSIMNSPPNERRIDDALGNSQSHNSNSHHSSNSSSSKERSSDVLSEPVGLSPEVEAAVDDIADIISKHILSARVDDSKAALVNFKPMKA